MLDRNPPAVAADPGVEVRGAIEPVGECAVAVGRDKPRVFLLDQGRAVLADAPQITSSRSASGAVTRMVARLESSRVCPTARSTISNTPPSVTISSRTLGSRSESMM
jgi:hypothetical protein